MSGGTTRFHHQGNDVYHYGPATYGPYIIVPEAGAVWVRPDFPLEVAALIGCSVTTGFGSVVNSAALRAGQSVAVFGCGGVGLNAVQGAVATGAYPIIGVDVLDNKLEIAREFGATHTINPTTQDLFEEVMRLTGHGVDASIVAVGNIKAMKQGLDILAKQGVEVVLGLPGHRADVPGRPGAADVGRAPHRRIALRQQQPDGRVPEDGRPRDGRQAQDRGARHEALRPRRGRRGVPGARSGRAGPRPDRVLSRLAVKLASVLTPLSDDNLTLAAQTGVEEIVCRYPGDDLSLLDEAQRRIESFGMKLGVIEGYLPIERIKLGTDDGTDIALMKALIRHLGETRRADWSVTTSWPAPTGSAPASTPPSAAARRSRRSTSPDSSTRASPAGRPFRADLEPGLEARRAVGEPRDAS